MNEQRGTTAYARQQATATAAHYTQDSRSSSTVEDELENRTAHTTVRRDAGGVYMPLAASESGHTIESVDSDSDHIAPTNEPKPVAINAASFTPPKRRRLLSAWWLELSSCILSLAALLALFGILYGYGGRPSPSWPSWISLNTMASIFVVILKTSVLFVVCEGIGQLKWSWFTKSPQPLEHIQMWDDATRGPYGASFLLGRLRGRELLASLGALIVVLTLAVDPATQQILYYDDCAIASSGIANIPRANSFDGGGYHLGALQESIVPGVQNAINAGVFNPNPYPSFQCSTGNCTWSSDYTTVATCSICEDITEQLEVVNITQVRANVLVKNATNQTTTTYEDEGYVLVTQVPDGISVNVSSTSMFGIEWGYAAMGPATAQVAGLSPADYTVITTIDFITSAKIPEICEQPSYATAWPCDGPTGTRCSLLPCVKTFNSSTEAGRMTETLVDTGSVWGGANFGGVMLDTRCLNADETQSLKELGYQIFDDQRYLPYNWTADLNWTKVDDTFPSSLLLHECLYRTEVTWMMSISDYFETLLSGTVVGYMPTPSTPSGYYMGPQIVQSFFDFGNATHASIEGMFENISISLTNYMRENGGSNYYTSDTNDPVYSQQAAGTVQQTKVCVRVRWGWFAYPATLVILTFVFFGFLLVETWSRTTPMRIWKSSALALLYHGLERNDQEQEDKHLDDVKQMERMAKSTAVRLEGDSDGRLRFVKQ